MKNLSKFALVCALGMFGFNVMADAPAPVVTPTTPVLEKKVEIKKDEVKKDEKKVEEKK